MTWKRHCVVETIPESTRDEWARIVVDYVRDGDDCDYMTSGDHIVFAMRIEGEIEVFDCLLDRSRVASLEAVGADADAPRVVRVRRKP